ncbi:MAG: hypothetical protein HQL93_01105 [Magnetococcales bacterium]|nr:hypothetical protein [Magnetococcales bacterium]
MFTRAGQVILKVSSVIEPGQDKARFTFRVEDTGCGIPPDKQHMIFQQFTQSDASLTRRRGGFGLGLAICKKLVEMMSGELKLVRSDSSGTVILCCVNLEIQTIATKVKGRTTPETPVERPPSAMIVDRDAVEQQVTIMARWLKKGNLKANESLEPLRKLLVGTALQVEFFKLEQAMDQFSFNVAQDHLETIARFLRRDDSNAP